MRYSYRHAAFTGTKQGITPNQHLKLKKELDKLRGEGFLWLHDGDCVEADQDAAWIWHRTDGLIQLHPPIKNAHRGFFPHARIICEPRDYLVRDKDMVACSELLVACPLTYDEQQRSGTWATVRYARKLRLKIILIFPDGSSRLDK